MLGDRGLVLAKSLLDGQKLYAYSANLTADFLHKQPILLILWQPGRELPDPATKSFSRQQPQTTKILDIMSEVC
jgi:hypothetical protein